jgi:hypothetical protein
MATRCTDVSENKKINQASPIAMAVFAVIYIVTTTLMRVGLAYFILLIAAFIACQILFYYKPRFVYLTVKFLFSNSYLTPSFHDKTYLPNEYEVESLRKILKGTENDKGIRSTARE